MIKRYFLGILFCFLTFSLFFNSSVFAQNYQQLVNANVDPGSLDIGQAAILPNSFLYPLKIVKEKLEGWLSSTPQSRAVRELEFSIRRLREVNGLVFTNRPDLIKVALTKYQLHLDNLQELIEKDPDLQVKTADELARQLFVLQQLYNKVQDDQSRQEVLASLIQVEKLDRSIVEQLNIKDQQNLINKIALRQAVACGVLSKIATSSSNIKDMKLTASAQDCLGYSKTIIKDKLEEIIQKTQNEN